MKSLFTVKQNSAARVCAAIPHLSSVGQYRGITTRYLYKEKALQQCAISAHFHQADINILHFAHTILFHGMVNMTSEVFVKALG